jgi:hypothetical protein
MKSAIILLAFIAVPAFAQFGIGIKAGLPLTDAVDVVNNPSLGNTVERKYIVGPQVELRLPAGFAVELDALYSNFQITRPGSTLSNLSGNSWEFPLLLKKRFGGAIVRPFVDIGASFRHLGGLKNIGNFIVGTAPSDPVQDRNNTGFVIGGGLELKLLFIRISPELRFTRWGTENFAQGVTNAFKTNKSQAQVLVGFSF